MRIERTVLPGVGLSQRFVTAHGRRVGIVSHVSGRRELVMYDSDDPDSVADTVVLEREEAQAVAGILDTIVTVDHLAELEQQVPGICVVRVPVSPGAPGDGQSIVDLELVDGMPSVVAIFRDGGVLPSPGGQFRFRGGDEVVVAGTPAATSQLAALLTGH